MQFSMKPETSVPSSARSQYAEMEDMQNARKSLHILQQAAGDKENLVGPGRSMQPTGKDFKKNKNEVEINNLINEKLSESNPPKGGKKKRKMVNRMVQTEKPKITVEDLTSEGKSSSSSEAGPSENYWELLAERRRIALENALRENAALHEKVCILEAEKTLTEQLLTEARNMVEVLTEITEINDDNTPES